MLLDVAFREDECRVRKGDGAENLSILRRMALNLLKREKTHKGGIEAKRCPRLRQFAKGNRLTAKRSAALSRFF